MSLPIDAIDHIVLNVADLEVSAAWYVRVLGMERIEFESRTGVRVRQRLRSSLTGSDLWLASRFVWRARLLGPSLVKNAGLSDTLAIDGREIPVESITKAIREAFLGSRAKQLTAKLTDSIVQTAFKKVVDEEQTQ